jgi:hypothetical protein
MTAATTAMMRVDRETHVAIQQLAHEEGMTMQEVMAKAVETYRRQRILEEASAAYAEMRSNPQAWAAEEAEREAWDNTLMDGLHEDEAPTHDYSEALQRELVSG